MAGSRGRPNTELLSRVGRIIALLRAHPGGLTTEELRVQVGYGTVGRASQLRTLNRDLVFLAEQGWRIDTVPCGNDSARRVLRTVDNRFATLFTAAERAELARVAACAGPAIADALADDLGRAGDSDLALVMADADGLSRLGICQAAAADRCRLAFDYSGTRRLASPIEVLLGQGMWYLRAMDHRDSEMKTFAIDRMRNVRKGAPGTARAVKAESAGQAVLDPMALQVNPPVEIELRTDEASVPDAIAALGNGGYRIGPAQPDGTRELTVSVTNLDALPGRLFELGRRVRLVGPPRVRARIAAALGLVKSQ